MDLVTVLVALFIGAYATIALIAWRRPLLGRLAMREAVRRPAQSMLLVAGLMTGTAAILAMSLIVDSAVNLDLLATELGWGHVDLQVTKGGGFFSRSVADDLTSDPAVRSRLSGIQAGADLLAGVTDLDRNMVSPMVRIVGYEPASQAPFGEFTLLNGSQTTGADLGPGSVLISRYAVDALDAHQGDLLRITSAGGAVDVHVGGILQAKGAGLFGGGPGILAIVYAPLASLAPVVPDGMINVVRLSAGGEGQGEIDRAHRAVPFVESVLGRSSEPLVVQEVKANDLKVAGEGPSAGRPFLTSFAVIILAAGTLLVVNLMFALSEERRPRLAVLRALGLTRSGQVMLSLLEGSLYALAAGLVGIVPGFVFAGVMWRQLVVSFGAPPDLVPLAPQTSSLIGAVTLGTLITLATVGLASFRGSRMSIAAAVKELPDRPGRRSRWRTAGIVALVLAALAAVVVNVPAARVMGGTVLISVAALIAARRLRPRPRAALLGLAIAGWNLLEVGRGSGVGGSDFIAWVISALLVSFGLAILGIAGYPLLETLIAMPGLGRTRAALRPSLAYLSRRPVPAALGVTTIGIVLSFLVDVQQVQVVSEASLERSAGRFDIAVLSPGNQDFAIPSQFSNQLTEQESIAGHIYTGSVRTYGSGANNDTTAGHQTLALVALTADQLTHPVFTIANRDGRYATDADAFRAMTSDPSLVLVNNNMNIGDHNDVELQSVSGTIHYRAIGTVNSPFVSGLVGSESSFAAFSDLPAGNILLLKTAPATDVAALARQIQQTVIREGAQVITRQQAIRQEVLMGLAFWNLIGILFTVGLIVGVASIGIIALRAVVERRRAIGLLRSLGFGPGMIMYGILVEALLTALTGAAIGVGLGLYELSQYITASHLAVSVLDYAALARTVALILGAVIVVTILPALQASRLAPAQALRLID